jgi:hypothetical protein
MNLKQMTEMLNQYLKENPDKADFPVVNVLYENINQGYDIEFEYFERKPAICKIDEPNEDHMYIDLDLEDENGNAIVLNW